MLEVDIDEFTKDLASSLCTLGIDSLNSLIIIANKASVNHVMKLWAPAPLSLKLLEIWVIQIPRVPSWIGSLDNLQHLRLHVEKLRSADVGLLGRLNALSCLSLLVAIEVADRSSSSQGVQRVKIKGAHGFPSLRKFQIGSYHCGFGLFFEAGAMPKLQELELRFDEAKTRSLSNGEFDFGIQHLPSLTTVACYLSYFKGSHDIEDLEPEAWER